MNRNYIENGGNERGFNFGVIMMIVKGFCKVENFRIVLTNPHFSYQQHNEFWNTNNWSINTEDRGVNYEEYIEGILDHTQNLNENQIDNPLSNSDNIINLMDNLELSEIDYKNILKYIINKI